jgi:type VI secretion system secreted protein VgrG
MPIADRTLAKLSVNELIERIQAALATFSSVSRLYDVDIEGASDPLTVEAFTHSESLSSINEVNLLLLSTDASLPVQQWLHQPCLLRVRLADGSEAQVSGVIRSAQCLAAEGGLARYQVSAVSWWWQLTQQSRSRVFQDKNVLQIVEQVFAGYTHAHWRVSDEVSAYVEALPKAVRPYTTQYRETDWDFVSRLLAEIGLSVCGRESDDAAAGSLWIFADSRQWPEDSSSVADAGVRFHRGHSQEAGDAIQAFGQRAQSVSGASTALGYQPLTKRSVTAQQRSTQLADGSALSTAAHPLATRERYGYGTRYASNAEAEFAMRLARQAAEAQARQWLGRGTTRSLRAGTWFSLTQSTFDQQFTQAGLRTEFGVLAVEQVGINNLPKPTQQSLTALFGSASEALSDVGRTPGVRRQLDGHVTWPTSLSQDTELLTTAQATGFACRFIALHREQRWTPSFQHRPTVPGPLTARVTGPGGTLTANGNDEIWIDALGRIQVRFFFQQGEQTDDVNTVWLRVKQQQAGGGLGFQVMPRIGHEVWVDFIQGDIDCPIVMGSVYNGRGEAGHAPTQAGKQQAVLQTDQSALQRSRDFAPAAQANLTGGNSPAWHGTGAGEQRNAAALTGFKDAALGANNPGFNQLVLDDTDQQLRTQLRTTHLGSELSLGHLIHQADNHRGSFKGAGVELRTDGYMALRAAQGVLLSTFGATPNKDTPAGDLTPALALAKQADGLLTTFANAAQTHQAIAPAALSGSIQANRSVLNEQQAPWPAVQVCLKGMVNSQQLGTALNDASKRTTQVDKQHVPHLSDPLIVTTAKANHLSVTGQSHIDAIGDTLHAATGADHVSQQGGHALHHTGQALSILAGVIKPGNNNLGIQAIAANDPLTMQAQADTLNVLARQAVQMSSQQGDVTLASPKAIHLKTEAGARISLINGNIEIHAPGTLTLKRAVSKQVAGESVDAAIIAMAHTSMEMPQPGPYGVRFATSGDDDLLADSGWAHLPYSVLDDKGNALTQGTIPEDGRLPRIPTSQLQKLELTIGHFDGSQLKPLPASASADQNTTHDGESATDMDDSSDDQNAGADAQPQDTRYLDSLTGSTDIGPFLSEDFVAELLKHT